MLEKYKNFFIRLLIFQFAFLFIFSKYANPNKSIIDFKKRIKFIAKNTNLSEEQIKAIELKSEIIFQVLFFSYSLMAFLALLDNTIGKQFTGFLTILMALIYCNPLTTIKKNYQKNNYQLDWKVYIPSTEFCAISCLGMAMMISSFYFKNDENDKKDQKQVAEEVKEVKLKENKRNNEKEDEIKEYKIIEEKKTA